MHSKDLKLGVIALLLLRPVFQSTFLGVQIVELVSGVFCRDFTGCEIFLRLFDCASDHGGDFRYN